MAQMNRITHIDSLRGLAVLLMVMVHAAATWNPFQGTQSSLLAYSISGLGGLAAPLFVTLFGWGVYRSEINIKQRVFYCLVLLLSQIMVNVSSPHIFNTFTPGVLSLMAILTLVMPIISGIVGEYDEKKLLIVIILTFSLQLSFPHIQGTGQWVERVSDDGITTILVNLLLTGTYPLFPWFIFAFVGAMVSSTYYADEPTLQLTKLGLIGITLGMMFCLLSFIISQYNDDLWAHPSSEAYLTFFPANPPFIVAGITGVMLLWFAVKRLKFVMLSSAGRISLTIYIIHFIPLSLMHDFQSLYGWSLELTAFIVVVYTIMWIPTSALWVYYFPKANLESLIKRLRRLL